MRTRTILPRYGANSRVDPEIAEHTGVQVAVVCEARLHAIRSEALTSNVVNDQRLSRIRDRPSANRPHQRLEPGIPSSPYGGREARQSGIAATEYHDRISRPIDPECLIDKAVRGPSYQRMRDC
ncbi:hypothetical protein GCM10009745_80830 [Kribbella yunnanensis]|uniref:Uncharacterized protein n=1 Tax=Kribbella yunnanensis TaxID=190194 RepID=A0ABN2J7Q3_9ACTN